MDKYVRAGLLLDAAGLSKRLADYTHWVFGEQDNVLSKKIKVSLEAGVRLTLVFFNDSQTGVETEDGLSVSFIVEKDEVYSVGIARFVNADLRSIVIFDKELTFAVNQERVRSAPPGQWHLPLAKFEGFVDDNGHFKPSFVGKTASGSVQTVIMTNLEAGIYVTQR